MSDKNTRQSAKFENEMDWPSHVYLTPAPHIVAEGVDPRECGECGQDHLGRKPGDLIEGR